MVWPIYWYIVSGGVYIYPFMVHAFIALTVSLILGSIAFILIQHREE